ncbi:MAG: flavodoxin family protein [Candidatus Bathyarchaeia archaeon]|jgi:multimeric flavodoxin WrbA
MKVLAINGSPRKTWNTATMLNNALEGAASAGAETEIIHLYDLNFKGCTSCFACKLKGGKNYGNCAYQDELTSVLKNVREVDALILGSPIYMGTVTGEMKKFLERLIFPYLVYDANRSSLFPKKIPVGFIYTMGADENRMKEMGIDRHIRLNEMILGRIFGASESIVVTDTYQFEDYSIYVSSFNVEEKARRRREVFPLDCEKSYRMGVRFAKKAGE